MCWWLERYGSLFMKICRRRNKEDFAVSPVATGSVALAADGHIAFVSPNGHAAAGGLAVGSKKVRRDRFRT